MGCSQAITFFLSFSLWVFLSFSLSLLNRVQWGEEERLCDERGDLWGSKVGTRAGREGRGHCRQGRGLGQWEGGEGDAQPAMKHS